MPLLSRHARKPHSPRSALLGAIAAGVARARKAEPLEFDQIVVRFGLGLVITVYAVISYFVETLDRQAAVVIILLLIGAWVFGAGFLAHLAIWPERKLERRTVSICADAVALSLLLGFAQKSAAMFFPVYLWVTLGNGFRFGIGYMYGAIAANAAGFIIMAALTPYWRESWQFSVGLALAIVVIPLYVANLIRRLRRAMAEAEAASLAKTEFLSMMSHELRTPLNAILGLAQLSRVTASSAKERFSAVSTELAAGRLLRMVDTILKFQRIESGGAVRHDRPFDPLEMMNEVRAIIEPLAQQKGLAFRIHFATALPLALLSDPDHVQTIILNLATNAVKYTRQGSVDLTLGLDEHGGRSELRIEVRDTGEGIPPEAQSRIFERFVRGPEHNILAESGVGLGLSVCRSLAELLGGSLGCESAPGEGSLFWAHLPMEAAPRAAEEEVPVPTAPVLWLSQSPMRMPAEAVLVGDLQTLRDIGAGPVPLSAHVLIVDMDGLDSAFSEGLQACLDGADRPPALIVLSASPGEPSALCAAAAACLAPAATSEFDALIATVARWQWLVSQQFAELAPEVTALSRRFRVLVADDNALNRDVTKRMLELHGHHVVLAETGDEALQSLLDGEVDVAFLDVNMPGLTGIEACRTYLSALGSDARIPMIGLTADISAGTREECLAAGMIKVLGKPVTLEQLHSALAEAELVSGSTAREAAPQRLPVDAVDEPVADEQRVAFLCGLFGEIAFREQFLASFKRDVSRNLALLRQGSEAGSSKMVRSALHAIKSSAGTAGARRLFKTAERLETSDLDAALPAMDAELDEEFRRFCAAVYEASGHPGADHPQMKSA